MGIKIPVIGATGLERILKQQKRGIIQNSFAADTGWVDASLINGWIQFDITTHGPISYRRIDGLIHIRGIATQPTGASQTLPAFVLPTGFRPVRKVILSGMTGAGTARYDIEPGGNGIYPLGFGAGANQWASFHAVFPADA